MKWMKNDYSKYIWMSFLFCFFFRLLFLFSINTMSISGDEIFSFLPAAKILGYNWESIVGYYRYYGFGYTLLLLPLMAMIKNPIILYRSMVLLMIIAQTLVAPISFHIMKKYLKVDNKNVLLLGSIACSFLVSIRAVYTYPEFIYDLMVWLAVWVMFKLLTIETKKGKMLYTFLLLAVIGYAMTIHARGITLLMALIVTTFFYVWVYRKTPISISLMAIVGISVYFISQFGTRCMLSFLKLGSSSDIGNTNPFASSFVVGLLKDPHSWTAWLTIMVGQINEAIINTGGLSIGIIVIFLVIFWNALIRKKEIIDSITFNYSPYILIAVFCVMCVVMTIGGQSISQLLPVTNAMYYDGHSDAFRTVTYFRYYAAYIGPLLMLGISYFYHNPEVLQWIKNKCVVIFGLLHGYWILCIVPFLYWYNGSVWSYAPFSFTKGFEDDIRIRTYLIGSAFLVLFLLVCYSLIKKNKSKYVLLSLCLLLTYNYAFNALYHEGYRSQMNYQYVEGGLKFISTLNKKERLEKVYVQEFYNYETGQGAHFTYQFHLQEIPISINQPERNLVKCIYICYNPKDSMELLEENYQLYKISEKEFAYIKGTSYIEFAEEYGLKCVNEKEVLE